MVRFSDHISERREPGETDSHLAARLGISRSHWRHIRTGRRPVTLNVARAAIAIWPELEEIYIAAVRAQLHAPGTPDVQAET